jgi:hypothetical protein
MKRARNIDESRVRRFINESRVRRFIDESRVRCPRASTEE